MSKFKLFGNKNKKDKNKGMSLADTEKTGENGINTSTNTIEETDTEEEEIIAVITAAAAMFMQKPVSGFRVVSFKRRPGWKLV